MLFPNRNYLLRIAAIPDVQRLCAPNRGAACITRSIYRILLADRYLCRKLPACLSRENGLRQALQALRQVTKSDLSFLPFLGTFWFIQRLPRYFFGWGSSFSLRVQTRFNANVYAGRFSWLLHDVKRIQRGVFCMVRFIFKEKFFWFNYLSQCCVQRV